MENPKPTKKKWSKPFKRPRPSDEVNARKKVLSIRLSNAEYALLEAKAGQCMMPISRYIRTCVLDKTPRAAMTAEEMKLYKDVASVRTDCQQMSNFFNRKVHEKDPENAKYWEVRTWDELQKVIQQLKKILKI